MITNAMITPPPSRSRILARLAALALSMGVSFGLGLMLTGCHHTAGDTASNWEHDAPLAGANIGGPFTLIDKAGKPVRWSDFAGYYRIVYFGYTFCPDACPTDMNVEALALARFAAAHPRAIDHIRPLFITIDPARDTPKAVGEFTAAFSPRLIGLTGSPMEIARVAREFAVYYARGRNVPGGYLMDHSRIAYLMAPDGAPIAMLPLDQGPDAVAAELAKWVR